MPEHTLTAERLREIQARIDGATGGPWTACVEGREHSAGSSCIRTATEDFERSGASAADLDFIAHARQDLPLLLAEIHRLRAGQR